MYERNAIVLERYFYGIFDFKNTSNLRENYYNYRKLFECYGNLGDAIEKEIVCQKEYDDASNEISNLQKVQEKLYNKSAKYEYSRYIIFSNFSEKTETIEKHLNKVNEDVQKNTDELKELGDRFVQAVIDYNEKKLNLEEAIKSRELAQKEYDLIYEKSKKCYEEITEELLENTKKFIKSDNKENRKELQEIFEENGKNERNQFDSDVISNTISKSFEIYKLEMDIYLAGYDRISKLFEEIESSSVKNDKHTKYYRDSKAKVDFLNAEKTYIVQFLDNERIGAIYDKKAHRKLMLEACKKFVLDFAQIEKLYDIILKEVAGRSTKKIYKENYNKGYLIELENVGVEPRLDTGKMRQEAIAFVNLNYWRVEGMKVIYETFEDIVTNIYEKDLSEYIPEELKEPEQVVETNEQENEIVEENIEKNDESIVQEKNRPRFVYYSSKIALAKAIYYNLPNLEEIENVEVYSDSMDNEEVLNSTEYENFNYEEDENDDFEFIEAEEEYEESEYIEDEEEYEGSEYVEAEEEYEEPEYVEAEEYEETEYIEAEDDGEEPEYIEAEEDIEELEYVEAEENEEPQYIESEEDIKESEYIETEGNNEISENIEEKIFEALDDLEDEYEENINSDKVQKIENIEQSNNFEHIENELDNQEIEVTEDKINEEVEEINEDETSEYIDENKISQLLDELDDIDSEVISKSNQKKSVKRFVRKIKGKESLRNSIENKIEEDKEEVVFDLNKIDEIDNVEKESVKIETEEDNLFSDEDDDDSILEIYFSDDDKEENDSIEESNFGKKVGLFKKLVGFNSKKRREA